LAAIVEPLPIARKVLREQLHRQLLEIVRHHEVCRRLMTTPGVGPVVALTFRATPRKRNQREAHLWIQNLGLVPQTELEQSVPGGVEGTYCHVDVKG
jgi:transposase